MEVKALVGTDMVVETNGDNMLEAINRESLREGQIVPYSLNSFGFSDLSVPGWFTGNLNALSFQNGSKAARQKLFLLQILFSLTMEINVYLYEDHQMVNRFIVV